MDDRGKLLSRAVHTTMSDGQQQKVIHYFMISYRNIRFTHSLSPCDDVGVLTSYQSSFNKIRIFDRYNKIHNDLVQCCQPQNP